jgi:RNA polymerase sigma factor (sigma-70 family)
LDDGYTWGAGVLGHRASLERAQVALAECVSELAHDGGELVVLDALVAQTSGFDRHNGSGGASWTPLLAVGVADTATVAECPERPASRISTRPDWPENPFCAGSLLSVSIETSSTRKDSQDHDRHLLDRSGRRCVRLYLHRARKAGAMSRTAGSWPAERVVSAAQQGDPRAITTLVCDSHTHVQRFARMLCSTPEDAEDAAQEALIVLYRKIGTLRTTAALASWMFQIVRNECIRRSRVTLRRPIPATPGEPSAEDAALVRLEIERIVESISGLPAEQRAALVLRDIQGLSGAATAHALGLSRAAMKSRLHRGRETLRSQLRATRVTPSHRGSDDARA